MQPLVDMSIKNIRKNHGELFQNGSLTIVHGDGRLGYEDDAPYDAIHVGAAAKEVPKAVRPSNLHKIGSKMRFFENIPLSPPAILPLSPLDMPPLFSSLTN